MRTTMASIVFALLVIGMTGCGGDDDDRKSREHKTGSEKSAKPTEHQDKHTGGAAIADTVVDGKARDPICGMIAQAKSNPEFVYRDTRFHFCSANCLEKFKAAPSKATTGLPGEGCVCSVGEMKNCKCGHCKGKLERCLCGDPKHMEGKHDHKHDDH